MSMPSSDPEETITEAIDRLLLQCRRARTLFQSVRAQILSRARALTAMPLPRSS